MQLVNHHSHTLYSDGLTTPEKYLEAAIEQGLHAYGFSDHAPIPMDNFGLMPMENLETYLSTVEQLKKQYEGKIQVYKSLEVDYIPGLISVDSEHIAQAKLDYTIGAVHYIDFLPNGEPWGFEGSPENFQFGIDTIFDGSARMAVERYFTLIREMVQLHCPDIVAHIERINQINKQECFFSRNENWYQEALQHTLNAISEAGAILEINTKGIVQNHELDVFPSRSTISYAHELKIPLHLSSDAHEPENITRHFEHGSQILQDLGCKNTLVLMGKNWEEAPLLKSNTLMH